MSKSINYVPHNKYRHVETRQTDDEYLDYLSRLSILVGSACDKFLNSRGLIEPSKYNYRNYNFSSKKPDEKPDEKSPTIPLETNLQEKNQSECV